MFDVVDTRGFVGSKRFRRNRRLHTKGEGVKSGSGRQCHPFVAGKRKDKGYGSHEGSSPEGSKGEVTSKLKNGSPLKLMERIVNGVLYIISRNNLMPQRNHTSGDIRISIGESLTV